MDSSSSSSSGRGKRGGEKTKTKPGSKKNKIETESAQNGTSLCPTSDDAFITKIGKLTKKDKFVNVRGKVIFNTLVHDWNSARGEGVKMYFDLADETGIIRVIAWNDIAEFAGKIVKRGKTIQLKHAEVQPKRPAFNNLDHPFQIKLGDDNASLEITELENHPIQARKLNVNFVPFESVPNMMENQYFDLSGDIESFNLCMGGRHAIGISDEVGNELTLSSFYDYIPLCNYMLDKRIDVIRAKYNAQYGNVDIMGAHVKIGGRRVRMYHLSHRCESTDSD